MGSAPALTLAGASALGERLRALDYTDRGLAMRLGAAGNVTARSSAAILARRAAGDDPLAIAFRLLGLGRSEPRAAVERALAGVDLTTLVEGGLLAEEGDDLRALVGLAPIGNRLVASDLGDPMAGGPDFVLGRTPSTISLLGHTIRGPASRALDVGCGGGVQALAAAGDCASVVASDSNPRALAFTRLNAGLNDVTNLDLRHGNWFEPVAGERFDLVLCNPPFVVSPDTEFTFRDAGLAADAVSRQVVKAAAEHLAENGLAHVMLSWVHDPADWEAPLREWTAHSGCDVWALRFYSSDVVAYADTWNAYLAERDPVAFEVTIDRWLAYYADLGIEAIGLGVLILRRRTARANWFRAATVSGPPAGDASDHGLRLFGAEDDVPPAALLEARIAPAPGQRLEQLLVVGAEGHRTEHVRVSAVPGLGLEATLAPGVGRVVLGCDGRRGLRDVIAGADADPAAAQKAIRRLLELGLVELG